MICPMENGDHTELLAYAARQLEGPPAERLREHVQACSACGEFVAKQSELWRALDVWEPPAIAADFDQRLYQRIERRVGWWNRCMAAFRPLLVRQGLPIAAAACLILVLGLVWRRPADRISPPQQGVQVENLQPEQVEHVLDDMQMLGDFTRATRADSGEL